MKFSNKSAGFTMIEMALSLAVITLIAGMSVPVYQSFQIRNDLDIATVSIVHSARRAEVLAGASDGDSNWGVKVEAGSIFVFKGSSFASRDSAYDEIFDLPASITPTGLLELVFTKFSGLPVSTGTTTLSSTAGEVRDIAINAKGTLTY